MRWRTGDGIFVVIAAAFVFLIVVAVGSERARERERQACIARGGDPVWHNRSGYVCYAKGVVLRDAQP